MTARRAVSLTGRREFRERMRSRAFRVSIAIQLVLVIGISLVAILTSDDGPSKVALGVSGPEATTIGIAARGHADAFDMSVTLKRYPDAGAARAAVADDKVDLALAGNRLLTSNSPDDQQVALVRSAAAGVRTTQELRDYGLSPTEVKRALAPPPLTEVEVDAGNSGGQGLAFVGVLLLYIAILTFGYAVTAGVIEEKSSRVIELLLSTIRARELLAGKVLGIGLVGLIQIVVVGGAGLAVAIGSGRLDLPSSTLTTALLVALYFVLGYLFYACAFAVAGALVSRQEDAQSTTSPMMVLLVGGYLASFSVIDNPHSGLATLFTFLPPVAPMTVPARAAQDALPLWELVVSVALMVVSTLLLIRLAGRVYERAVMRMGAPLKLTQALKLAREPL
jgi:ABC-2 type transport system permease protein